MAKRSEPDDAEAFVAEAAAPFRRCVICNEPKALDFMRRALKAMQRIGAPVSRKKMAQRLTLECGRNVHENTVRNHWIDEHDPEAGKPPERRSRVR